MPFVSQRKRRIDELEKEYEETLEEGRELGHFLFDSEEEEYEEVQEYIEAIAEEYAEEVCEDLENVKSNRYLYPRTKLNKKRTTDNEWERKVLALDEQEFRKHVRMSKSSFYTLCKLMKETAEPYKVKRSGRRGASVELQLLIALFKLGCEGNASSSSKVLNVSMGVSEGTVIGYTNKLIDVLCSMSEDWIKWPDQPTKQKMKDSIQAKDGFPDCVGFIDGTVVPLTLTPSYRADELYTEKNSYCIQCVAICDDNRRILYFDTGFMGSAQDADVFDECSFGKDVSKYIQNEEYLLGDSGYPCRSYLVTPFTKDDIPFTHDQRKFNKLISFNRVAIEQCFSILKSRFQSLKGLRKLIFDENDVHSCSKWIVACCVLHNMLLDDVYDDLLINNDASPPNTHINEIASVFNDTLITDQSIPAGEAKRNLILKKVLNKS